MQAWDAFLLGLEQTMGKTTVDRWLRPLTIVNFDACNLYLEAQNSFQIAWFEEHVRKKAENSLLNNNSHPIKIHFIKAPKAKKEAAAEPVLDLQLAPDSLDQTMQFSNFTADDKNQLTLQFFKELKPVVFNPVFLYGPQGIGKTHLLMATAQKLQSEGLSVFYVHTETFTEHVVKAIRSSQMRKFREIYRKSDVLIIDDVHELARKAATQEELFHTFNTLHTGGKQIILCSHLPPGKLEEIEPRLISRFEWGIVLQLHPLPPERMEEVLHNRAKAYQFPLSDPLAKFIVEKFHTSSKSMLRALEALVLRHKQATELSVEAATRLLADLLDVEKKNELTPERILSATSAYFGIRVDDILGKSQAKEVTFPRKVAMYLCRKHLGLPFLTIGKIFGRDHSTVMSSIKFIEASSEEIEDALDKINLNIK